MTEPAALSHTRYYFLEGGGELGTLTRSHDWDASSLGSPDKWPQSLRISVSTVLNSAFPMLLFWGEDMICFYNDAFRPSLGAEGRHPGIGRKGMDLWEDVWEFAGPLLESVMQTGKPVYFENQLVPFYRNGQIEDIYWTFSYSPVYNDEGKIGGVLVVCNETTELVVANRKLRESEDRFKAVINAAPFPIGIYTGREMKVSYVNQSIIDAWGKGTDVVGKTFIEVLPELKDEEFPKQLDKVFTSGEPFRARNQRVNLVMNGKSTQFYFHYDYTPLLDADGKVYAVMNTAVDVTDLVTAQEQLRESEQRVRDVIMASRFPMAVYIGREMRINIANQSIIDIWGKGNDVIGRTYYDLLPELESQDIYPLLDGVYTSGMPFHAYNQRIGLVVDGTMREFYFDYSFIPLFDREGNVYGVLNSAADVTEVNISKRKIEESEQQVRSIVASAPFPIAVYTGPEKTIAFANQSIMDVWGKGNDVVGKTYTEILPELENQKIFDQVTAVYETGVPFHARNQRVDLVVDGKLQPFWFNYSFTPLFDKKGRVYGVMNTAAEVTDLNRAKQQVEESERNLRNMILQSPVATCIYRGENSVIEIANNAMFEFWGVDAEDVLGKPLFEAMPNIKNQGFEEILSNVRNTGVPFVADEMVATLMRNGAPENVFIRFTLEPMRETDGSISGIMAVAVDVTAQVNARREIEQVVAARTAELADANQNLKRSNAELEQFAYIASHDLQEPLRKVTTFTQMLEMSLGDVPEQAKNYLEKINSSTERMTGLIRDVLHYSQLSRDDSKVFEKVNLNSVLDMVATDYDLLIAQKNARLTYDGLPEIEALPRQMSQLFTNLVSNALKFSKPGVAPEITISAHKLTDKEREDFPSLNTGVPYYNIQVRDNGIGFEQEHARKIFNIFQRLHGKTEYVGTGIGLAMCKKITLNHKGDIFASSAPGEGAVFCILLPERQP